MTLGVNVSTKLLPVVLLPLLVGCSNDEPAAPVDLEVTVQGWTGWQREQPAPTALSVTLGESETFTVDVTGGKVTVTVVDIDDDEIHLETSRKLAPESEGGGIDLNETTDEFSLERGGQVEFSTPTTDAGTKVTVAEG